MSDINSKFHIIATPVTVDIQALTHTYSFTHSHTHTHTHTYTVCGCVYNQSSHQNCTRLIEADVSVTVFRQRLKSILMFF